VIPNDPASLNPCLAQDEGAGYVIGQVFNNLVMMDADYNIIPDLADTWKNNDDYTQLTFHLHPGVKWHDGEAFFSRRRCLYDEQHQGKCRGRFRQTSRTLRVSKPSTTTPSCSTSAVPDATLLCSLARFGRLDHPETYLRGHRLDHQCGEPGPVRDRSLQI
jgi:hypothetical protein